MQVNGRYLDVGTEFSVRGIRGRFRFISESNGIVSAWGGAKGKEHMRFFHVEQIKTVHWTVKTGKGLWEARKHGAARRA